MLKKIIINKDIHKLHFIKLYIIIIARELCDSCIAEESPDSTGRKCWVTPSRGNPRDSATENIPPYR